MAREKGLYRRQDSPYWWVDTVLPDGRRVCQSTRLKILEDAEEFLVRLKADAMRQPGPGYRQSKNGRQRFLDTWKTTRKSAVLQPISSSCWSSTRISGTGAWWTSTWMYSECLSSIESRLMV